MSVAESWRLTIVLQSKIKFDVDFTFFMWGFQLRVREFFMVLCVGIPKFNKHYYIGFSLFVRYSKHKCSWWHTKQTQQKFSSENRRKLKQKQPDLCNRIAALPKNFLPMFGKFCLCATKPYKIHICKFLFLSFYCWLERLRGSRYHWQKLKWKHTTKEIDFCQLKNREATDTYITHTILY